MGLRAAVLLCLVAPAVRAQSVVEILQRQRLEARIAEAAAELGPFVAPRPVPLAETADPFDRAYAAIAARRRALADSARVAAAAQYLADSLAGIPVRTVWNKVEPDEQGAFLERFREVFWRASDPRRLALDTTATPVVRGRLQSVFGRPTRNADALRQVGYTGNEYVQFEYWFVVNDSIPVLLLDLDGPFGRGLLLAGSEAFADQLPLLKADLSERLFAASGPAPFVDYYHSFERRQWYRTGYNGTEYFTVEIRPPGWVQSRAVDRWVIHR
ncbi:MAG TPA: hypothetical protein VF594_00600 [Rubricoccaceae bacterium]